MARPRITDPGLGLKDMRKHFCKVPDGIKDGHLPSRVAYDDELLSGHDPGGDDGDSD